MRIFDLVQRPDTTAGRVFDTFVLLLIVYSITTLSIETIPNLSGSTIEFLRVSEIVVTIVFTLEYVLRVVCSKKKLDYVFSFDGLIDLIAIVPFYLAIGLNLQGIRAFRLFRVIRILKLTRYSKAMNRFGKALVLAREEAILFMLVTVILLYLSAVGIYYFEHQAQPEVFSSIPHSLWWAVATLTTVGYGDVFPITAGGKIFTFVILMLGLGIVAVPSGLVASTLSQVREDEEGDQNK